MSTMFILRGLPGSGKSTKAIKLASAFNAVIVSADDWMITPEGEYRYDPRQLPQAHKHCQLAAARLVEAGVPVVIDNPNTQRWHFNSYIKLAEEHDYLWALIEAAVARARTSDGARYYDGHGGVIPATFTRALADEPEVVEYLRRLDNQHTSDVRRFLITLAEIVR